MDSHQLTEEKVFTQHYSKLCDTLTDIRNLLPHFVTEKIIKSDDEEEISALTTSSQKVQKLLRHISGPLKAGHTRGFYTMLKIMEIYGTQATQELASQMNNSLSSSGILTDHFDSGKCVCRL